MSDTDQSARKKGEKQRDIAFVDIVRFVMRRWLEHPAFLTRTLMGIALATIADVATPVLSGRL